MPASGAVASADRHAAANENLHKMPNNPFARQLQSVDKVCRRAALKCSCIRNDVEPFASRKLLEKN